MFLLLLICRFLFRFFYLDTYHYIGYQRKFGSPLSSLLVTRPLQQKLGTSLIAIDLSQTCFSPLPRCCLAKGSSLSSEYCVFLAYFRASQRRWPAGLKFLSSVQIDVSPSWNETEKEIKLIATNINGRVSSENNRLNQAK